MLAKPFLVLSSYSLLFALLALRLDFIWLKWILAALAAVGVAGLIIVIAVAMRASAEEHTIESIRGPGAEASAYLASYLLPFVISSKPGAWDLVAYALFLVVAGIVTARTDVIQVNPLVYLAGYRVLKVTDTGGLTMLLLMRGAKRPKDRVRIHRLPTSGVGIVS